MDGNAEQLGWGACVGYEGTQVCLVCACCGGFREPGEEGTSVMGPEEPLRVLTSRARLKATGGHDQKGLVIRLASLLYKYVCTQVDSR